MVAVEGLHAQVHIGKAEIAASVSGQCPDDGKQSRDEQKPK